uniref:Mannose-6-phosphate isomerase n=1 Tax=Rhodopseudomonas palustris (strain BisA53) TaxID=316055 RepID=Q07IN1_RHOP5
MPTPLEDELQTAKAWLVDKALPFWANAGFDADTDLFVERTDFAGRRLDAPLRLMVQSRQIYVFAHATLLGWFDGRELVRRGLQALLKHFATGHAEAPFAFSVDATGRVIDSSADTYGYAFLLFALAWSRRLLGADVDPATVSSIIAFLQSRLRHPSGQGFVDGLPRRQLGLRQNPQMHVLEACLEVADAFDHAQARAICDDIVSLFETRLFSSRDQALVELHDDRWEIADPAQAVFEPGHHFEWIWLLDRYRIATGRSSQIPISALAHRAEREGIDGSGTVIEQVRLLGGDRVVSRRCWATCEGLKAAAADFRSGRDRAAAEQRAARFLQALRRGFLSGPFPGGWIDRIDAEGRPLLDYVPASTLYHLTLAIAEADRAFGDDI